MSYVDLFSQQRWSEADHTARTQAMVRAVVSRDEEEILNRDVLGAITGMGAPMDAALQARAVAAKTVMEAARQAGVVARADSALLDAVLDIEAGAAPREGASPAVLALLAEREARRAGAGSL